MAEGGSFEDWYRTAHPRLVAAMTFLTRDRPAAEDVAAEACSRCLERWESGSAPDDPSAWTYTVAVNLARRRWRRIRRERDLVAATAAASPLTFGDPELELWRAVAALPERARLAVVLRYIAGLGEAEIAAVMGIAPGTVAATLSKARSRLAISLTADGLGPDAGDADGPTDGEAAAAPGRSAHG